jgi:hypothetical protein
MHYDWIIVPSTMPEAAIFCMGKHLGAAIASLRTRTSSVGLVGGAARTSYTIEPQSVRHRGTSPVVVFAAN